MNYFFKSKLPLLVIGLLFSPLVLSQLTIDVIGGGQDQIPITILPFGGEKSEGAISKIVSADLERSGLFNVKQVPSLQSVPTDFSAINFEYWRGEQAENLVIGK